ncbi:MAG: hypothetical protein KTR13_00470, partial [Saprospiraceae bacterium]|nr:hypothetical protein [Saprospiraceae bacterium]
MASSILFASFGVLMNIMLKPFSIFLLLWFVSGDLWAQTTDCVGAFPVCGNGDINLNSNGIGANDFAASGNNPPSCQFVESQSLWLFIRIKQSGTLGFDLIPTNNTGPNRDDYDFAVYGPNRSCTNLGSNIRCSSTNPQNANVQAETGMNGAETDLFEGPGEDGNGFVQWLDVVAGETYYILIDNFSENEGFELRWTGSALLEDRITKEEGGVDLGPDILACGSDGVELDATTAIGATSFMWSTGEMTPTISPDVSGEYWVQVTNSSDCISRDSVIVTLSPDPEIFSLNANPNSFCEIGDLTLTATGSESTEAAYEWFFPNGNLAGTGTSLSLTGLTSANSGDYILRLTNDDNCFVEESVNVAIFPLPDTTILGRTDYCETETLLLEGVGDGAFTWKDPIGNIIGNDIGLTFPDLMFVDAGMYRLIRESVEGCLDSVDFEVTVAPELTVMATSNSPVCSNETLVLEASSNNASTSFEWIDPSGTSIGGGLSLSITDPLPSNSGTYTLRGINDI